MADRPTIQECRRALEAASDDLESARAAKGALRSLIAEKESRAQSAGWPVDTAARALIVAEVSPFARQIWEYHARITHEAKELDRVVQWLRGLAPSSDAGGSNLVLGNSHLPTPRAHGAYDGAADAWEAARQALHTDADARLPPIPGAEPTPPAKR